MITTKSTPASRRSRSLYGWSAAVGSLVRAAATTAGESATAVAAAVACRRAVSSACRPALTYANTAQPMTTTATSTTCIAKSCPARLRGPRSRRGGRGRGSRMQNSLHGYRRTVCTVTFT